MHWISLLFSRLSFFHYLPWYADLSTKRGVKPLSTTKSLPFSALLMYLVRLMYLGSDPLLVSGSVIKGIHEAITPLTIMAGAIMLFETMETTRCLPYMMREMKALTGGHHVAELSIIYSFAMMVEGASGFGTPVALGAPTVKLSKSRLYNIISTGVSEGSQNKLYSLSGFGIVIFLVAYESIVVNSK